MDRVTVELLAPLLREERYREAARQRLAREAARREGRTFALAAATGRLLIAAGEWLQSLGGGPARLSPTREPSLRPGARPAPDRRRGEAAGSAVTPGGG